MGTIHAALLMGKQDLEKRIACLEATEIFAE